jgi:hypothetical protein
MYGKLGLHFSLITYMRSVSRPVDVIQTQDLLCRWTQASNCRQKRESTDVLGLCGIRAEDSRMRAGRNPSLSTLQHWRRHLACKLRTLREEVQFKRRDE